MSENTTNTSRRKLILFVSAAVLLTAAAFYFDLAGRLRLVLDWVEDLGPTGPLVYIVLYILVTILLVPGSILTMGAGAVFGVLPGTLYTSVGSTLGAAAAFLIGRYLLRDWVAAKAAENPKFQAVDEAIGRKGGRIIMLLRLSPLLPFNLSNYIYSLSKVRFGSYVLASWIGMLPGTLVYVYIGSLLESLTVITVDQRSRTTGEWVLYAVGLAATIAVSIYVTRVARRAIQQALV